MSEQWDHSPRRSGLPKEFLVSAELYVSTAAAAALRKPAHPYKRSEKHETSIGQPQENRKLREKSSWLALSKGPTGPGHWRSATCRLSEEGERCLLNIYVDESILYQTVYMHLLHQTDVRQADSSLFFRKECLGLYCIAGQRWTSTHTAEPVYLQFSSPDLCNTWFALLRSYAIPEIYGRWAFPEDGGSYRMWRQVELTVIQGRGLGNTRLFDVGIGADTNAEPDAIDLVKKGIGSPDWHESFTFSDLPPFESLDVLVWREKKLFKPTILGSVPIPLGNFRRGDTIEGWFPVLHNGSMASDIQVGELRLKLRVDEEIILPYSAYSGLLKTFKSRNFLDWMNDFETKLKLKTISAHLMSVAIARNVLVEQVQELASREVDGTPSSHQTLFRGNTILTKVMELSMAWYGKAFLEASIGSVLRRLCAEKVSIEVDPLRSGKSTKDVERNVDQLIYWCQEFWNQIYSVRAECPQEMRRLFETIRTLVEKRYRPENGSPELNRELPWQSVSAFCFLRFIVPAILHPHLFGLCPGLPSAPVQRSLTLIAKVIQSLANLNSSVQKEDFMRGVKDFLKDSVPAMVDYIRVVSTPAVDYNPFPGSMSDRHDRLNVVNHLRERVSTMQVLDKEAVPALPHMLDIPRHLAIVTSAVIRSSRPFQERPKPHDAADRPLDEFCAKCLDVEEHALLRVSQLAAKISSDRLQHFNHQQRVLSQNTQPSDPSPSSTSGPSTDRQLRKLPRPSTAPSPSELSSPQRHMFGDGPDSRFFTRTPTEPDVRTTSQVARRMHLKSTSTDSVPSFGVGSASGPTPALRPAEPPADSDDTGKRVRGLFRGILRR
ncbi:putative Ras GTPase-activating-like protein ngap [Hypsizygus marmoreus]|uniref:Ras GTPase-activating-like protein ngap n=1 Tax=Hypsizygus marmoreus TaxID=39966 RepID=A0A369K4P6_HYPMA|nr:putative Ras GTPase-activating-like protein ngap [Hypsizygus marmoreus]